MRRTPTRVVLLVALVAVTAACGGDENAGGGVSGPPTTEAIAGQTITLLTHESFWVSEGILEAFTAETGVEVVVQHAGDTGEMVAASILTVGNPLGDVMYGIDNTFLQRALDADLFEAYESPALANVPTEFQLDNRHRVTPIDFGDVCANYWTDAFDGNLPAPTELSDLADPAYRGMLVVQNPETSSPGLAFLLATISRFGDGWPEFWEALRKNDVTVTAGWEDAYYGEFISGGGTRPIVISYASSPPAEVIYADPPTDTAPTGVITDTCFRQVEFAGILAGTTHRAAAEALVDFLLSDTFQEDIPLSMFVFPVSSTADLPQEFVDHVVLPEDPHMLTVGHIGEHRNDWTEQWTQVVLR